MRIRRIFWAAAGVAALGLDAYLLTHQWPAIGGNVLAEPIIATPTAFAFIAQHMALRRHVDRRHAELHRRLDKTLGPRGDTMQTTVEDS